MLSRRLFLAGLPCLALSTAASAQSSPVFFAADGAALSGYDAVTYFSDGRPKPGQPGISVMWKGAVWHFASQENLEQFERNPRAFAPQFGGYCAYAMRSGYLSSADPNAWKIVDGRLYLTHSPAIERMWQENVSQNIRLAEENWPRVLYD